MRRITIAVLGTLSSLVLLFLYPTSHNGTVTSEASPQTSSGGSTGASSGTSSGGSAAASGTKTYNGDAVQTRWGTVQVQIAVAKGKIVSAKALQYPNDNGHDQEINSYALPILDAEVVKAQNASIDAVSGATVTSDGYISSLQSAVDAAKL